MAFARFKSIPEGNYVNINPKHVAAVYDDEDGNIVIHTTAVARGGEGCFFRVEGSVGDVIQALDAQDR
ncbi:hypothetical protein SAMN02745911_1199 [Aureimonas altamirensis DSM 21988]|nr:hypothetical protein [Aureimonas altamirensis]SHI79783.1 hypothetical protein SAMN02745911_1199 [Aureimonas altamirensis DSM 21988]